MKTNEEYRILEQQLAASEDKVWELMLEKAPILVRDRRQLAEAQKQIVELREALEKIRKEQVIYTTTYQIAEKALAATKDLSNCILCDAEPVGYLYRHNSAFGDGSIWSHRPLHNGQDALESLPLYQAKEKP